MLAVKKRFCDSVSDQIPHKASAFVKHDGVHDETRDFDRNSFAIDSLRFGWQCLQHKGVDLES